MESREVRGILWDGYQLTDPMSEKSIRMIC